MEETTVVIVGAGPTGLALAVNLGRMNIKTVILEMELEVSEDPRGIAIAGDAVRISYQLGIGDALVAKIGSGKATISMFKFRRLCSQLLWWPDTGTLYFHHKTFQNPPFMNFDLNHDHLQQTVSNAINQFQPNYGCEVLDRVEEEAGVIVHYLDNNGDKRVIRTSWLVGADGKRGIVRKKFLEPEGIRQEVGLYDHVSTWIAANFDIALPSPATHPDFPLWKLGYTPEQVYELFWPAGFHFCNDIKRPAVSGRFGPKGVRFWRHEYSIEPEDNLDDPVHHLWAQFGSWLDIPGSRISDTLSGTTVAYPQDCVKVVRCRPFTFSTKVVNRWYCRRTLLVGDAAHVFPPFGGQGIASGIRDAQALSWRLTFLSRLPVTRSVREKVLTGWAHERRQVCDHATKLTKINGSITNQRSAILAFFYRSLMRLLWYVPTMVRMITRSAIGDTFRYQMCEGGLMLREKGGGYKLPQIWVRRGKGDPELSDEVFISDMGRLALIVIVRGDEQVDEAGVAKFIEGTELPGGILTPESITLLHLDNRKAAPYKSNPSQLKYRPCSHADLLAEGVRPINGYDEKSLERRIGKAAKYVIVRPDFYIHSIASDEEELLKNVQEIARYFELAEDK
ncbi:hypothetical protein MMC08_000053 [Hypocenomyce scalaris]|nr:hypothetical protein [Hypocenomyce scalaris]